MLLRGDFRPSCDGAELIETATGRRIFVRGVNVPAKLPPFRHNLTRADLALLLSYGFTAVRLTVAWEALEPEEGRYDFVYIEELRATVRLCAQHGISVLIDPHQDCWSRWTGGDGAPRWTLERLGFELSDLEACCATLPSSSSGHPLLWLTNYQLFASATLFALFFGSERFAPHVRVGGLSAQRWLQTRFIDAFAALATVLRDERNVLGFGTLNEPSLGWIGCRDLRRIATPYRFGYGLSPLQCIQLAHGRSLSGVLFYGYPLVPTGVRTLNPEGRCALAPGREAIWPEDIRPDHFALAAGEAAEPTFVHPFWDAFGRRIRSCGGEGLYIFTEPLPLEDLGYRRHHPETDTPMRTLRPVYELHTPHYYDLITIGLQRFLSWFAIDFSTGWPTVTDPARARHNTLEMLRATVLGEVGMCWMGDTLTDPALDATFQALESNRIPVVFLWCYVPGHVRDDGWNGEDFSICSANRLRMLRAVRPYPLRVAGRVLHMRHDGRRFELRFESGGADCEGGVDTLLYVTPHWRGITLSDGRCEVVDGDRARVRYYHTPALGRAVHTVCVWFE